MSPLQGDHVGSQPTASTELKESYGSILKGSMGFFYYLYMLEIDWHRKYGVYKNTIDYSYFDKNGIVFDKFEI